LHDKTYQLALKWYSQLPEIQKQKILEIYGELPPPEENIQGNGKINFFSLFHLKSKL